MSARVFETPAALLDAVGESFGPTTWVAIEQDRIDLFAQATDDHQWIHVDPERAKDGPFGGTIAHGYLTMSLVNRFLPELIEVRGVSMGVNIGTDNLRFLNPVRSGSRIRGKGELIKAEEAKGGVQAMIRVTVEIEGVEKPACVVDTISRFYPEN
ncbi:dehydratase [Sphingopyxis lindanitolerans]|uniref:Dehydratase n=1 Tax=Sphingopyxis lindanitolerans TaxID=2054227 RepID=A0A2S8B534_9SPHN|nr:MaoC family dehydratase [Sphingopyxis lindanitolerans]PQM27511.1 dehydratase [Sphingopyxis lindanitolerans]